MLLAEQAELIEGLEGLVVFLTHEDIQIPVLLPPVVSH
jgi:hypothetical protein